MLLPTEAAALLDALAPAFTRAGRGTGRAGGTTARPASRRSAEPAAQVALTAAGSDQAPDPTG